MVVKLTLAHTHAHTHTNYAHKGNDDASVALPSRTQREIQVHSHKHPNHLPILLHPPLDPAAAGGRLPVRPQARRRQLPVTGTLVTDKLTVHRDGRGVVSSDLLHVHLNGPGPSGTSTSKCAHTHTHRASYMLYSPCFLSPALATAVQNIAACRNIDVLFIHAIEYIQR